MKYLKVILLSILIGSVLSLIFLLDLKKKIDNSEVVYAFQVGVFKTKENAIMYQKEFESSITYYDNEYYRVFIAVTNNIKVKEKLMNYFDKNNIKYFIKEYSFKKKIYEFDKYNEILIKTDSSKVVYKVNNEMLRIFLSYLS